MRDVGLQSSFDYVNEVLQTVVGNQASPLKDRNIPASVP